MKPELPNPECEFGYTQKQLEKILGPDLERFNKFMYGQTGAICGGRQWDYNTQKYVPCCNGISHGMVVYGTDLRRFLLALPVID